MKIKALFACRVQEQVVEMIKGISEERDYKAKLREALEENVG